MAKKKKEELLQAGFIDGVPVCPCCGKHISNSVTVDVDSYVCKENELETLLRFIKRCLECRTEFIIFSTGHTLKSGGKYILINEEEYIRK